jgi:hypothetical protein
VIEQRLTRLVIVGGVIEVAIDHCTNGPNRASCHLLLRPRRDASIIELGRATNEVD